MTGLENMQVEKILSTHHELDQNQVSKALANSEREDFDIKSQIASEALIGGGVVVHLNKVREIIDFWSSDNPLAQHLYACEYDE